MFARYKQLFLFYYTCFMCLNELCDVYNFIFMYKLLIVCMFKQSLCYILCLYICIYVCRGTHGRLALQLNVLSSLNNV